MVGQGFEPSMFGLLVLLFPLLLVNSNLINKNITWEQPFVRIYGCKNKVPRKTKFLAEKDISYRYSGTLHNGNGWPDWFYPLLEIVNCACKVKFNVYDFFPSGSFWSS